MPKKRRRGWWRRLRRWSALVLAAFVGGSVLATLALRWLPPLTTALIMERRVAALAAGRSYAVDRRWVAADRVSPHTFVAVIAAEDQKFPTHWGFDPESIADAIEDGQRGRRMRGASTLSQQVAKNLFLWPGRSFVRKGLEAYWTILIELLWPKRRILEMYVNIAELGPGVFGVEAASQRYFKKPANRLNPSEAARLAAVLPNPLRLRADRPSSYVLERQQWILQQMEQLGGPSMLEAMEFAATTRR